MTLETSIEMIEAHGACMKEFGAFLQEIEDIHGVRFLTKLIAEFRQRLDDYGPTGYLEWGAIAFGAQASVRNTGLRKSAESLGTSLHSLLDNSKERPTVEDLEWIRKVLDRIRNGYEDDQRAEESVRAYLKAPTDAVPAQPAVASGDPSIIKQSELETVMATYNLAGRMAHDISERMQKHRYFLEPGAWWAGECSGFDMEYQETDTIASFEGLTIQPAEQKARMDQRNAK